MSAVIQLELPNITRLEGVNNFKAAAESIDTSLAETFNLIMPLCVFYPVVNELRNECEYLNWLPECI